MTVNSKVKQLWDDPSKQSVMWIPCRYELSVHVVHGGGSNKTFLEQTADSNFGRLAKSHNTRHHN
jgi:hypothetical protein